MRAHVTPVVICVPSANGWQRAALSKMLNDATIKSFDPECPFSFSYLPVIGYKPQAFAMNTAVRAFLNTKAEWLWFVDADMEPPEDWYALMQYADTHDMIAGTFFAHDLDEQGAVRLKVCAFLRDEFGVPMTNPAAVGKDADASGSGCLLIHRRVLEDERMLRYGSLTGPSDEPDWAPAFFEDRRAPNGRVLAGLDTEFTGRATSLGYRLKVHMGGLWDQVEDLRLGSVMLAMKREAEAATA